MNKLPPYLLGTPAVISDDGKYRYWLERDLAGIGTGTFAVVFIMLNPSTADATQDDPTIRRCIGYARKWNAGRLIVVNLFALRATDPRQLWAEHTVDPVGPLNDEAIYRACDVAHGDRHDGGKIICAWGNHGSYMDRGDTVRGQIEKHFGAPLALRISKSMRPAHPLYLPASLEPCPWPTHPNHRGGE